MADTLPTHYTTEYSSNWIHRVQQTKGRLDAFVEDENYSGERKRYDRISASVSRKRTERKGPTITTDQEYDFRWATNDSYDVAKLLDKDDARKLGQLVLPTSDIIKTHAAAYHRDADDVAWQAALGSVLTGENGTTVTAFDTTNQWIGKGGVVGASTGTATGLTIGKLITAKRILSHADIEDETPLVLVCTAYEIENLLNTTKVTSGDYNSIKALVNGTVDTFMGFKFVLNKRLTVSSNVRTCVAWMKGAIKRIKGPLSGRVDILPTQSMATQIYSDWYLGATRVYDEGVIQIDCDESAVQPT